MPQNADLTAVIDGDTKGLTTALQGAVSSMQSFESGAGASLKSLDETFKSAFSGIEDSYNVLITTLGAAIPIIGLQYLHRERDKAIDDFRKIGDAADQVGVGTDFLQGLKYSAGQAHVEFSKVTDALKEYAKQIGQLKKDDGELNNRLGDTNETLKEQLKGAKDMESAIGIAGDAIAKLKTTNEQYVMTVRLFGKDHVEMSRVVREGGAAMTQAAEDAKRLGLTVDESLIRRAQDIKTGFGTAADVINLKFKQSLINLSPLLDSMAAKLATLTDGVRLLYERFAMETGQKSDQGLQEELNLLEGRLREVRAHVASLQARGGNSWIDIFAGEKNTISGWATEETKLLGQIEAVGKEMDARREKLKNREPPINPWDLPSDKKDDSKKDDAAARKLLEGQRDMDELMKRTWEAEHRYYLSIEADAAKDVQRFKLDLENKKITEEQYTIAMVLINRDMYAKIQNEQDKLSTHLRESMKGISTEFEKIFTSWQSGHAMTLQAIERDFIQMIERMVLKAAVLEPLFGTGKAGDNEFGAFGKGFQSLFGSGGVGPQPGGLGLGSTFSGFSLGGLFGGGGSTAASTAPKGFGDSGGMFSGLYHEGGTVGAGGPGRWVDSGVFEGAVRYHAGGIAGLLPGEMPAILQQGEGVISKETMQNGGAGRGHTFNVSIQTPNPQSFGESHGQISAMLSQAVARGDRNL